MRPQALRFELRGPAQKSGLNTTSAPRWRCPPQRVICYECFQTGNVQTCETRVQDCEVLVADEFRSRPSQTFLSFSMIYSACIPNDGRQAVRPAFSTTTV